MESTRGVRSRTAAVLGLVWALVVLAGGGTAAAFGVTEDDAGRPYVDAFMDEALEGADDDARRALEPFECYAEAVVDIVGVDQLERAGVTPRDFADDSSTLTDLGIEVDGPAREDMLTAARRCDVSTSFGAAAAGELSDELGEAVGEDGVDGLDPDGLGCVEAAFVADQRLPGYLVDAHIGTLPESELETLVEGLTLDAVSGCPAVFGAVLESVVDATGMSVGPEARACFEEQLVGDAQTVRALLEDAMRTGDDSAGSAWFAGVMARCPSLIVEPLIEGLDEAGMPAGPGGRACLEEELAARPEQVAAIFTGADQAAAEAFGVELIEACSGAFDG